MTLPRRARILLLLAAMPTLTLLDAGSSMQPLGAGLLAMVLWLLVSSNTRRTVRGDVMRRFMTVCVLSDSLWLGGVSGALERISGERTGAAAVLRPERGPRGPVTASGWTQEW